MPSVEKLSVNLLQLFQYSVGARRNPADLFPLSGGSSACARHRGADASGAEGSTLRVQGPMCVDRLAGPDAPQGGSQEQGQAADSGVAEDDGPGRKRQGDRCGYGSNSDHCGHQNHPSNHLAHPPERLQLQPVAAPWQDYGRALVNLRRIGMEKEGRGKAPPAPDGQVLAAQRVRRDPAAAAMAMPSVDFSRQVRRWNEGMSRGGSGETPWVLPGAATCRKVTVDLLQANPDAAEECLSFVISRQQGRPANQGAGH